MSPISATSWVPVINIHGMRTSPKAASGFPCRGLLGLKASAARMRLSVKAAPKAPNRCPLTAWVVTAPKECPDIPIARRFILPWSGWPWVAFHSSRAFRTAGTS